MSDKEFKCKHCPASYTRFSALKQHMIDKHIAQPSNQPNKIKSVKVSKPKSETNNVCCETCGKSFSNKYNMQRHMETACNPDPEILLKTLKPGPALSILTALLKSGHLGLTTNNTQNVTNNTNNGSIDNHVENHLTQNNNNLNLNQSFNINPLGQENMDHISEERRIAILRKGINAVGALYEALMEDPANHNVAVTNKRLKKVMYKDRDGKITIGDLHRVINMVATDSIDKIDDFLEKYGNRLPLRDKTILRLMEAQSFPVPGEDPRDFVLPDESLVFDYHIKCENLILDVLELHKKRILTRLTAHKTKLEQANFLT